MGVTLQQSSEVLVTGNIVQGSFSDNVFLWEQMKVPFTPMYEPIRAAGETETTVIIDEHLSLPALRDLVGELIDVLQAMEKATEGQ